MTSLFSRLQKLNKDGTRCPTCGSAVTLYTADEATSSYDPIPPDSLPAVLNLIEAAQRVVILEYDARKTDAQNDELQRRGRAFREALAVFVSGQEEPT